MNILILGRYSILAKQFHSARKGVGSMSQAQSISRGSDSRADDILEYWLGDSWKSASRWDPLAKDNSQKWFGKSEDVDTHIRNEFGQDVELLESTYKTSWNRLYNKEASLDECVAYIILGDQFCRNMFRGTKDMYQADGFILPLSKHLVENKELNNMTLPLMFFTLLPLMHSEQLADQEQCLELFTELLKEAEAGGHEEAQSFLTQVVSYAKSHVDVVAAYGRFPHRNAILGRSNTAQEEQGFNEGTIPSF